MRLIYHPEAEVEVVEAAQFYEGRVPGLGERFLEAFQQAITQIQEAPHRWVAIEDDLRRYTLQSFPYSIYYRVEGEALRILVVKHHSRHPDYWRPRLSDGG